MALHFQYEGLTQKHADVQSAVQSRDNLSPDMQNIILDGGETTQ